MAIDGEFPIEYLILEPSTKNNTALVLPQHFKRDLSLRGFTCPM